MINMKTKFIKYLSFLLVVGFVFTTSCTEKLEVENYNTPDSKKALSSPDDVVGLASGAFRVWHNAQHSTSGPSFAMATMADQLTCSWGNFSMKDMSSEPRTAWNNAVEYSYANITSVYWQRLYSAMSQGNDALVILEGGEVDFGDDTEMLKAISYFSQGISMGYAALVFDQGFIVDETTDPTLVPVSVPYSELGAAAVTYLDKAIAICKASAFNVPSNFIRGVSITNVELGQLANSFAARIVVYNSRTAAENAAVNWASVLTYAQNGIDFTLAPDMDNDTWFDSYKYYGYYWLRADHRIINMMDNNYPSRWPNDNATWDTSDGSAPAPASSNDSRLASYFKYESDNSFKPDRGYYHFSHYSVVKFKPFILDGRTGPSPSYSVYENDLFIAEAQFRTGDKTGAIATLNASSRVLEGGLAALPTTATDAEVLAAIFYERDIELVMTGLGISFFDMRRRDMLQTGTILHFPIPGSELEALGLPYYTIEDAADRSTGGWTGL